jgi:hypothetical protein
MCYSVLLFSRSFVSVRFPALLFNRFFPFLSVIEGLKVSLQASVSLTLEEQNATPSDISNLVLMSVHHVMKMGGMEIKLHAFSAFVLGSELSASVSGRFTLEERAICGHC